MHNYTTPLFKGIRTPHPAESMPDINNGYYGYYNLFNCKLTPENLTQPNPFKNLSCVHELAYNWIVLDIDSQLNLQQALASVKKLEDLLQIPLTILFSGAKGFHVYLHLSLLTPEARELFAPSLIVARRCKLVATQLSIINKISNIDLNIYSIVRCFPFSCKRHYKTHNYRVIIDPSIDTIDTILERAKIGPHGTLTPPANLSCPTLSNIILDLPKKGNLNTKLYASTQQAIRQGKTLSQIQDITTETLEDAGLSKEEAKSDPFHKRNQELFEQALNEKVNIDREFIKKIHEPLTHYYQDIETSHLFAYCQKQGYYKKINHKLFEGRIKQFVIDHHPKFIAGKEKKIYDSLVFPLKNLSQPNLQFVQWGSQTINMKTFEFVESSPDLFVNIKLALSPSPFWNDLDNNPFYVFLVDAYGSHVANLCVDLLAAPLNPNSSIFLLYGPPATGKSTLLNLLRLTLPGRTSSFSLSERDSFCQEELGESICNISDEFTYLTNYSILFLKRSTGSQQSPIFFNPKYRKPFYLTPPNTFVLCCNNLPTIPDPALERRVSVIEFSQTIKNKKLDEDFAKKIHNEYKQHIIDLMLLGTRRISEQGFAETNQNEIFSSAIQRFLQAIENHDIDDLVLNLDKSIKRDQLYKQFLSYVNLNKLPAMSSNAFYKELDTKGFKSKRNNKGRFYIGFELLHPS